MSLRWALQTWEEEKRHGFGGRRIILTHFLNYPFQLRKEVSITRFSYGSLPLSLRESQNGEGGPNQIKNKLQD